MRRPVTWARAALDDMREQIGFIAQNNPEAARSIVDRLRSTGEMATGRPGRVTGTYKKSVTRLPYIISYKLRSILDQESVVILRVIHTARDWPAQDWP